MPPSPSPHRIGILGSGQVGQTLAQAFSCHGYEVHIGTRSPGKLAGFTQKTGIPETSFAEVAAWSEALVLAVLGSAALDALNLVGADNLAGRTVLHTTDPLSAEPPQDAVLRVFTGPNESLMERLQTTYPGASFVEVFNSVGSALMVNPAIPSGRPTMFYCGNDPNAKAFVAQVLEQFGWDGADMGKVTAARHRAPLPTLVYSRVPSERLAARLSARETLRRGA